MRILVVNDDGILSEGIKALADFLSEEHEVTVVAPDGNRSAFSHSLSIFKDTIVKELKITDKYRTFATSGTPADCVKFAVHKFSDKKFDLICSGINKGHNLGSDTVYSGTISACLEGCFFGIKGIAFSNYAIKDCDFDGNIKTLSRIFDKLCDIETVKENICLNTRHYAKRQLTWSTVKHQTKQFSSDTSQKGRRKRLWQAQKTICPKKQKRLRSQQDASNPKERRPKFLWPFQKGFSRNSERQFSPSPLLLTFSSNLCLTSAHLLTPKPPILQA